MAKSSKLSDDDEKSRVGLGGFTKDLKGTLKKIATHRMVVDNGG